MQKCHPGWIHDGLHWKGTHRDPPGTHRPCHLRNWSAWYWGKDLTQQCCAPGIKPGSHIYIYILDADTAVFAFYDGNTSQWFFKYGFHVRFDILLPAHFSVGLCSDLSCAFLYLWILALVSVQFSAWAQLDCALMFMSENSDCGEALCWFPCS